MTKVNYILNMIQCAIYISLLTCTSLHVRCKNVQMMYIITSLVPWGQLICNEETTCNRHNVINHRQGDDQLHIITHQPIINHTSLYLISSSFPCIDQHMSEICNWMITNDGFRNSREEYFCHKKLHVIFFVLKIQVHDKDDFAQGLCLILIRICHQSSRIVYPYDTFPRFSADSI